MILNINDDIYCCLVYNCYMHVNNYSNCSGSTNSHSTGSLDDRRRQIQRLLETPIPFNDLELQGQLALLRVRANGDITELDAYIEALSKAIKNPTSSNRNFLRFEEMCLRNDDNKLFKSMGEEHIKSICKPDRNIVELGEIVGSGNTANVHKYCPGKVGPFAVKVGATEFLADDYNFGRLNVHPSIAEVYMHVEDNTGTSYVFMQYIEGSTLLDMYPVLAPQDRFKYLTIAAKVGVDLKIKGYCYQDVNAGNLMVKESGELVFIDVGALNQFSDGELVRFCQDLGCLFDNLEKGAKEKSGHILMLAQRLCTFKGDDGAAENLLQEIINSTLK